MTVGTEQPIVIPDRRTLLLELAIQFHEGKIREAIGQYVDSIRLRVEAMPSSFPFFLYWKIQ